MTYNPMLSGDIGFNRPVEQPNLMSTVTGFLGAALDRPEPKALTESEKFQRDWGEFINNKPAGTQIDRKLMRDFIFQYPQHQPKATEFGKNIGVQMVDPLEAARDQATNDYFSTPEGILAAAQASNLATEEEQTAFLSKSMTSYYETQAAISELERNKARLEAEGSLANEQWNVLYGPRKDFTDNVVGVVLNPILTDVMNGVSVDVDPQTKAQLGLRYDRIDMSNLPAVLQDTRAFLLKQHRLAYQTNFGTDARPPKEWEDRVMAPIDALIQIGNQIDSPQERMSAMKAIIGTDLITKLDKNNMAGVLYVAENFPDVLANQVLAGNLTQLTATIFDSTTGSIFGSKQIATNISNSSVEDAKGIANATIQMIGKELKPELFTAFTEAAKRSGYNVVDSATFEQLVSKNLTNIKTLTSADPTFRQEFSDWLYGDISATVTAVQRAAGNGVNIVFENGKYVAKTKEGFENTPEFKARSRAILPEVMTPEEFVNDQLRSLPDGLNLDTLNKKYATLKLMGDVGTEVQDALGMASGITNIQPLSGQLPEATGSMMPASLIRTESGGSFAAANDIEGAGGKGHYGRGQFSIGRLNEAKAAGVIPQDMSPQDFLGNEEAQIAVENWHVQDILDYIGTTGLDQFLGQTINGVEVTRNGMIAVAHLGGKGGLKRFLESAGKYNPSDVFGTSLSDYLRTHSGNTVTRGAIGTGSNQAPVLSPRPQGRTTSDSQVAPVEAPRGAVEPLSTAQVGEVQEAAVEAPSGSQGRSEGASRMTSVDVDVARFLDSLDGSAVQVFKSEESLNRAKSEGKVQTGDQVILNGKVVTIE